MKQLLCSRIFRYGVAYAGLFFISALLAMMFLYFFAFNITDRNVDSRLTEETQWLAEQFRNSSVSEMVERLDFYIADHPGHQGVYLLLDSQGKRVAGNLDFTPEVTLVPGEFTFFYHQDSTNEKEPLLHIKATVLEKAGVGRFIIGQNYEAIDQIKQEIRPVIAWTLVISFILGVSVAFFLARRLAARLEIINRSSLTILEGNLDTRMELTGSSDEFDNLSSNLNLMLDRIFGLMESVRGVTDNIAHDLRSPLSRMRSRMEVALLADRTREEYQDALVETVEDTDRLLTTFNSLLTIARVESGELRDDFKTMDAGKLVADSAEFYGPLAEENDQTLAVVISGDLVMTGNSDLLVQALTNLLDNAIKYAPPGAKIYMAARRAGDVIQLEVSDNGPGIPAHFREKALQRFTRLESSRTKPGQGLGLSLVQVVAMLHGGNIRLSNANPGLRVVVEVAVSPHS